MAGFVGRAHGELIHIAFAQRDHACTVKAFNNSCIVGRDEAFEHL